MMISFKKILLLALIFFLGPEIASGLPCVQRHDNPQDCVCNSTYCDTPPTVEWCLNQDVIVGYVTSELGDRFKPVKSYFNGFNKFPSSDFILRINPCRSYQNITGFGGALTDATSIVINSLSEKALQNLMLSYFDSELGIGYNYLRIPLGSTDFSDVFYTYDDTNAEDPKLEQFSLANIDYDLKIPLLHMAQKISSIPLFLNAAAWYAPKWMTIPMQNNVNIINPLHYEAWANYQLKALEEYKSQGINITYLTPGNEPIISIFSNTWNIYDYQYWFNNFLCPAIKQSDLNNVKLLLLDDLTNYLPYWQELLLDPVTNNCTDGFATHWYFDPSDQGISFIQNSFCSMFPDKDLQSTESSICKHDYDYEMTSDWEKAVQYGENIITKLNSCIKAYLDWNLALNSEGGPNYEGNLCYAPIEVNATADEFYKKALFYVLGHFSKFILPGSIRTDVQIFPYMNNIDFVAFEVNSPNCWNTHLVLIVLNRNDEDYNANICIKENKCASMTVLKNSIMSTISLMPYTVNC